MPVTGVSKVKAGYKRVFKEIRDKKAVQFITAVNSIGASASKELAPMEFSTLVNSQIMDVDIVGSKVIGTVSFNTFYAAFLEFNPKWRPRPINLKEGPAWNPKAEPHFLRKGFESPESKAAIKQAIDIFRV
jgi:hypothetical protein